VTFWHDDSPPSPAVSPILLGVCSPCHLRPFFPAVFPRMTLLLGCAFFFFQSVFLNDWSLASSFFPLCLRSSTLSAAPPLPAAFFPHFGSSLLGKKKWPGRVDHFVSFPSFSRYARSLLNCLSSSECDPGSFPFLLFHFRGFRAFSSSRQVPHVCLPTLLHPSGRNLIPQVARPSLLFF